MSEKLFIGAAALLLLSACGQTGQLYLPETQQGEVVTRPTQTPPPDTDAISNSSQSVDSPSAPATPAAEVTEPEEDGDKDKQDGATRPPEST